MKEYQVVIIGGGPGGYETAIRLAQYGITCAVVESQRLGGVCLNCGCIPTKALVKSAELYREMKEADQYGLPVVDAPVDYAQVLERKDKIVEQLVGGIEFLFKKRSIEVIKARATAVAPLGDKWKVSLDSGEEISGDRVILATGSVPKSLPNITIDEVDVLSSTGILAMDKLPKSLAVIGGGVIGCEFASIMNSFGVEVHIIEFLPRIVALEDDEMCRRLAPALKKQGIKVNTKVGLQTIKKTDAGLELGLSNDSTLVVEKVLMAVGRAPNLDIEFPAGAPELDKGAVVIDDQMRTSLKGIFAIGDVTGKLALAHTASKQGLMVAEIIRDEFEGKESHMEPLNYANIPRCTFTSPELASVGLSEAEAKEKYGEIIVGKFPFSASGKAMAMGDTNGFVKTIARADDQTLLGMHILGPNAAELIGQGAILVSLGAKADAVEDIVFAHPTLSESLKESIEDIRKMSIHKI